MTPCIAFLKLVNELFSDGLKRIYFIVFVCYSFRSLAIYLCYYSIYKFSFETDAHFLTFCTLMSFSCNILSWFMCPCITVIY
jgi:predicted permease